MKNVWNQTHSKKGKKEKEKKRKLNKNKRTRRVKGAMTVESKKEDDYLPIKEKQKDGPEQLLSRFFVCVSTVWVGSVGSWYRRYDGSCIDLSGGSQWFYRKIASVQHYCVEKCII